MTGQRLLFLVLVVLAAACSRQEAPATITRTAIAAVEMGTATRVTPALAPAPRRGGLTTPP